MATINMKQLKAAMTWLKNYIDKKTENITSGGGSGGTSTTTEVTKEYVDQKMLYDGYKTIYTVTADAITNAAQKYDNGSYTLSADGVMELDLTGNTKYIIEYEGTVYQATATDDAGGGKFFEDGVLTSSRIGIINKFDLYSSNNSRCRVNITNVDTSKITDLVVKKKVTSNLKVLALTKTDYDAIETKDENTLYVVTE